MYSVFLISFQYWIIVKFGDSLKRLMWKTPVENEMLNISANLLEISFFSNFNIFVGMMLDPANLFKSSEDIMFCISNLLVGLRKKEFWVLFFRKSEKRFAEGFIFYFVFSAIVAKQLLKIFEISTFLVILKPLQDKFFEISEERFLKFILDFTPFQVILKFFILVLKHWL